MRDAADVCTREIHHLEAAGQASGSTNPFIWINALGYGPVRVCGPAGVCGVQRLLYTGALVVGITAERRAGRYCYATTAEAAAALYGWDGLGDPPGGWIKYKGDGGERIGPGCSLDSD